MNHYQLLTSATILVSFVIIAGVWTETYEPKVWQDRLILPSYVDEPNRHTPVHFLGTFLPPTVEVSKTYTAQDNPVIIPGKVVVPAGVALTFARGTHVVIHEYGYLDIAGTLIVDGRGGSEVTFTTNESHPMNRTWSGLVFRPKSIGKITRAVFAYASPAITCELGSHIDILQSTITLGNVGAYIASPACTIAQSTIEGVDIGVITTGVQTYMPGTTIRAREQMVQEGMASALFK